MTARDIIIDIMEKKDVSLSTLAGRLSVSIQTMWGRLKEKKSRAGDFSVTKLNETVKALDYKIVIMPREARVPADSYTIE